MTNNAVSARTEFDEHGKAVTRTIYADDRASTGQRITCALALRIADDVLSGNTNDWTDDDIWRARAYISQMRTQIGRDGVEGTRLTHDIDMAILG